MSNKVAIVSDIHFGVNKNSELFLNSGVKFFKEQFVPYLKKEKITTILILGDIFDNRTNINVRVNDEVYNLFCTVLVDFDVKILVGNHDIYYRTTNEVHSLKYFNHFPNVEVIDTIKHKQINGVNAMFCPWIFDYKDKTIIEKFDASDADILFGHFDIVGFALNRMKISAEGLTVDAFHKFKKVFSGHYHSPSSKRIGNTEIVYIGSPYQMTRNDIDESKGFIVLDMNTFKYKRISNETSVKFVSVKYPEIPDSKIIEGNIVDAVFHLEKKDLEGNIVEKYVELIEKMCPAEKVHIVLNISSEHESDFDKVKSKITSIKDLIELYITNSNDIENKEEILYEIMKIYEKVK